MMTDEDIKARLLQIRSICVEIYDELDRRSKKEKPSYESWKEQN